MARAQVIFAARRGLAQDPRAGLLRSLGVALAAMLVLLGALAAGFGWLDLLRAHGALAAGPALRDSLPLRQLAGQSAQPLARVILAWISVGIGAGLILGRLGRLRRLALLAPLSLLLLLIASQAAYAVEESQNFGSTLFSRRPGIGVLLEAVLLMFGVVAIPRRAPGRLRRR